MPPIPSVIRNLFCELLALGLIASGRVRAARDTALGGNVITCIYFHNPNRRLFARCIQWLINHGYIFISVDDLVEILHHRRPIPKGAVWLSFDDGYKEWLLNVVPLVRQRRVPVTFFIPSGIVQSDGLFPWVHHRLPVATDIKNNARDAVTVSELKSIADYPEVTIGGHTVNHTVTAALPEDRTRFELGESKRILETWTGAAIRCFSYPVGLYDGHEKPLLREFGYKLAATTEATFVTSDTDPY